MSESDGSGAGARRIVLLRHGRTAWNATGRFQGQADVSLDDLGREQAERTATPVAAMRPSQLWSSDLERARETAQPIADRTGLQLRTDPRLREIAVGRIQGLDKQQFAEAEPDFAGRWRAGERGYEAVGGESVAEVRERTAAAVRDVLAGLGKGETAVMVAHGACIRIALSELLGWPEEQMRTVAALDNTGWVELTDDAPSTAPGCGLRLAAYNRVAEFASEEDVR